MYKFYNTILEILFFISLNSSKSNKLLKWYPRYRTKEAIDKTVEWYKKNSQKEKNISKQQLIDFIKK